MRERFDQRSGVEAIRFRKLIELCHLRHENTVREFECFRQRRLEDGTARCIRAWFEDCPDAMASITTAQSLQSLSNRGGVVSKVINHLDPLLFPAELLAARDSFERFERAPNLCHRDAIKPRGRRGHGGVANIKLSR